MIRFVKNGNYRNLELHIKRFVNGVETPGDEFPIIENITSKFGNEEIVTEQYLVTMPDSMFAQRVEAFKTHLLSKYPFLSVNDFINSAGGNDPIFCVPDVINGTAEIVIDEETNIIFYFDSTGSMGNTYQKLDIMRRTVLKDRLFSYYNNDQEKYDEKVRLKNFSNERAFYAANNQGLSVSEKFIIVVVQNEAVPVYHNSVFNGTIPLQLSQDITALRETIESQRPTAYNVLMVHVTGAGGWITYSNAYKEMMEAIRNGTSGFETETTNLSNYPEVNYLYDLDSDATPEYYLDALVTSLQSMGYRI